MPAENIVFRVADGRAVKHALRTGVGIGFMQLWEAAQEPDLVQVAEPRDDWAAPLWLVTHVDLHRTAKVQAVLSHLKAEAEHWALD